MRYFLGFKLIQKRTHVLFHTCDTLYSIQPRAYFSLEGSGHFTKEKVIITFLDYKGANLSFPMIVKKNIYGVTKMDFSNYPQFPIIYLPAKLK